MMRGAVRTLALTFAVMLSAGGLHVPVLAHHSFAMYDQSQTKTFTGKLTRYIPGSNHAQLIFEVLQKFSRGRTTEVIISAHNEVKLRLLPHLEGNRQLQGI